MLDRTWILVTALLLATVQAYAAPKVESWQTARGAKVMYVQAPDLPMVDVRVVFDGGSARDDDNPGIATLVNALLAEGAGEWDADQVAERLEDVGAQLGNDSLRDMAYVSLRSLTDEPVLRVALDTLAAILAQPRFSPDDVERQRQLMLIALRKQDEAPGDVASRAFYKALYGDHPYGHDPLGDRDSVTAVTREALVAFHQRYYAARNAVIAIVGAVSREQAEKMAEELTAGLPEGEAAPPLPPVASAAARSLDVDFDASQSHLYLGVPGMKRGDEDYFPLYVGNHVLGGGGLVSLLSQEVREKRGLSYSVYSYFYPMRVPGPFLMSAQTRNDRAGETLRVLRETLGEYLDQGPSDAELTAAKRNLTGGFPLRVASNKKIVQYIAMMGFYDYPLDYLDTFVARVEAVSAEDIRRAFRDRIDAGRLVTVRVGGAGG
ncbi:MAG: pitrilysin family protein [Pseudomonadota bacterium]